MTKRLDNDEWLRKKLREAHVDEREFFNVWTNPEKQKRELEFVLSDTPFVSKQITVGFVQYPPLTRSETELEKMARQSDERIRLKKLQAKANTVALPVDNGEYHYYEKTTGTFAPLPWTGGPHPEIVLTPEEMVIARNAFKAKYPNYRWVEAYYDLENNKRPS